MIVFLVIQFTAALQWSIGPQLRAVAFDSGLVRSCSGVTIYQFRCDPLPCTGGLPREVDAALDLLPVAWPHADGRQRTYGFGVCWHHLGDGEVDCRGYSACTCESRVRF